MGVSLEQDLPSKWSAEGQAKLVPASVRNEPFIATMEEQGVRSAWDADSRVFHSHGHTCREIFALRNGTSLGRCVDVVLWPTNHSDVVKIVSAASEHNVCIVPYGGGTSVTAALQIPAAEERMVVSLDMHDMCRVLHLDKALAVSIPRHLPLRHLPPLHLPLRRLPPRHLST